MFTAMVPDHRPVVSAPQYRRGIGIRPPAASAMVIMRSRRDSRIVERTPRRV